MKRQSDLQSLQIASSFLFGLNSSDKKRLVGKDCSAEVQTTAVLLHQSIVISVVVGDGGAGVEGGGGRRRGGGCTTGGRQQATEASFTSP